MNSEDPKKPESMSIPEMLDQALTAFDNTITQTKDLPIFPTDDIVIFPAAMAVLNVTDNMQIAAVDRAIRENEHVIAMPVKQRPNARKVSYGELKSYYSVATQARVVKLSKIDDRGAFQITLQGEKRVGPVSINYDKTNDILRASAILIHACRFIIVTSPGQPVGSRLFRQLCRQLGGLSRLQRQGIRIHSNLRRDPSHRHLDFRNTPWSSGAVPNNSFH